jgi:hypothetical protein
MSSAQPVHQRLAKMQATLNSRNLDFIRKMGGAANAETNIAD